MRKAKQVLACFLAVIMIVSAPFCAGVTAFAEDEAEVDILDYITYKITNETVTVTDCDTTLSGEIVIPDTIDSYPVTAIGGNAFYSCSNITAVTLPDGVTEIGYAAFRSCSALTDITLPDTVTAIGDNAFYDCRSLTAIEIPDGVTAIGTYTFRNCKSLESVTIPDSVTSIGNNAFESCSALTEITIPAGVTAISYGTFWNCSALESIAIPDSVTTVGNNAFTGCTNLKTVSIGKGVEAFEGTSGHFFASKNIESITVDEDNAYFSNDEYGALFNKDKTELIQYPVGNSRTSYTIPDSVTKIGNEAFSYSSYLSSVTIPDSVTEIGKSAFYYCSRFTAITIPDSVVSIGDSAFYGCQQIKSITIPDGVTSVGAKAFGGCNNVTSLTLSDSVTLIGEAAFYGCNSLGSITVDENNANYMSDEYGVLYNKEKTELIQYPAGNSSTEYTIPDSVTSIGYGAFYYSKKLTGIVIPESVTAIGNSAFAYCSKLESITVYNPDCSIYDSSSTLYSGAMIYGYEDSTAQTYADTYSRTFVALTVTEPDVDEPDVEEPDIEEPNVSDGLTYEITDGGITITRCDESASGSVSVPDEIDGYTVIAIGDGAFADCVSVTEVMIPDTVTSVGDGAFSGCEALKKTVAVGAESIGDEAFAGCTALDTFITFADNVVISDTAFGENEALTVFVKDTAEVTAPDALNTVSFSFEEGVLSFYGEYKSDLYYLFDLVTVMCAYYDGVEYLFFDSFEAVSADEGNIYYYTENGERRQFDGTKATNVQFSVEAFDSTGEFRHFSFNELCEAVVNEEVSDFYLIIESADGLDTGNMEISLVDYINLVVQRILKALTNLINKLFSFFKAFNKK